MLDFGRLPSGSPYMVMEFLEGEDLSHWLEVRGVLPAELAVDLILQAGVALAGAHAAGIVHRDIKPANLFCTLGNDGQPLLKVLDFGISKLTEAAMKDSGLSVTKTATVMGSPLYMSPEQVQNSKDVDARTDIWSLGIVLFELLARRTPFSGETFGEVAIKIATLATPPLGQFRAGLPAGLDGVMARCLAKDRAQRFANVAELAAALAPYASRRGQATVERIAGIQLSTSSPGSFASAHSARMPPSAVSAEIPETVSPWSGAPPGRSSRLALVGTLGVLMAALAGAGLLLWRRGAASGEPATSASAIATAASEVTAPVTASPAMVPATPAPATVAVAPASADAAPLPAPSSLPEPTAEPTRAPSNKRSAPTARTDRPTPAPTPAAKPEPPPRPVPAARPAPPKPDCDPPYTLDTQGRKKFKPECFLK